MDTTVAPQVSYQPAGGTTTYFAETEDIWVSNTIYEVKNSDPITNTTGDGAANIRISVAQDTLGTLQAASTNNSLTIDTIKPQITVTVLAAGNGIEIVFNETVTGHLNAANYNIPGLNIVSVTDITAAAPPIVGVTKVQIETSEQSVQTYILTTTGIVDQAGNPPDSVTFTGVSANSPQFTIRGGGCFIRTLSVCNY